MAETLPRIIWEGPGDSNRYRVVEVYAPDEPETEFQDRMIAERFDGHNAMGEARWNPCEWICDDWVIEILSHFLRGDNHG